MPNLHIVRETKIEKSFRVSQICGMFDFDQSTIREEWNSTLPVHEKKWGIGLIVGSSGSGKTTLAKEAFKDFRFHEGYKWDLTKSVADGFPDEFNVKQIVSAFNSVGFSSPPHWLKPFSHLSNGQKFRVELARCILTEKNGVVFDEFTSVVDRDVAKIGCAAISKFIRKNESPPFVAVSCHYDIIDWLDPDWVFDVNLQRFEWRERRRFPQIIINIEKTDRKTWDLFRKYHYLDHNLSNSAQCYLATWEDKPVGFCSVIHFPHPSSRILKREHRTVVLPDFQGIGIGNRLSEFVAKIYVNLGYRFISTTSAPSMIKYRSNSKNWRCHRFGRVAMPKTGIQSKDKSISIKRITGGFEYIKS